MSLPNSVRLVTFDATNTLLNFRVPPWEYYALVAKNYGYKGTADNLKPKMKYSYSKMDKEYPNFGKDSISWYKWWSQVIKMTLVDDLPDSKKLSEIADVLINDFKTVKCWRLADGSENILNLLQKSGTDIGVISNFDPRLHDILKNMGLHGSFKFVLTSYEVGISKPDKGIFELAQNHCGKMIKPEHCVHIGDDFRKDYKGAKDAKWHSILINEKYDMKHVNPKHVFKNIELLHKELLQIKSRSSNNK
ncbi:rhythmically expressed gene 2 protein-like [Aricia agestis]|uniref:rhythmically expressed gene 2 protein-like n=1 Tax=Aricia agestis TaxID=91739 RepID=UPI001C202065|nr:rhythmically expressed gene 2 protein-like [Aricia agestis]